MSPNYEYGCEDCGVVQEINHAIKKKPRVIKCASCGSSNVIRKFSAPSIITHGSSRPPKKRKTRLIKSRAQLEDMQNELKEDYNVHTVTPTGKNSFADVYTDIKEQGDAVKEQMTKKREGEQSRVVKKHKDWMKGAIRRTPERTEQKKKEKKKEAYKKRSLL